MKTAAVLGFSKGKPHDTSHGDLVIHWEESVDAVRSLGPSRLDVIVCPFLHSVYGRHGSGDIDTSHLDPLAQALLRASDLGVACCLLVGGQDPPLVKDLPTCLGERLLRMEGVGVRAMGRGLTVEPRFLAMGAEVFEDYLRPFRPLAYLAFELPEGHVPVPYLILAHGAGANRDVWGFAVRKGQGLIYVLPGQPTPENRTDLLPLVIHSLLRFKSRSRPREPSVMNSFQFTREKDVRARRETLAKEASELDEELAEYDRRKDILFLRDDDLADRLADWLREYLQLPTNRIEEYREDLSIIDQQGDERAICEVKALNQNVKRKHISQLVLHREETEKSDDFPSVLVANTFADAATVKEKDKQRIGKLELAKAVREHVLLVRTLDLVRILDHVESGRLTYAQVEDLLLNNVGWLRVTEKGHEVVEK